MKRLLCFVFLLQMSVIPLLVSAQVTIKIEKLSKPETLLPMQEVLPRWCTGNTLSINVDADSLVYFDETNPFFYGMYEAYANHRPFVLSPDMIWLLISQGFSHHINADPEKYRDRIVDFSGKLSLVIKSEQPLDSARWDELIPQFAEKIKDNTKGTIAETIITDFSTTTQYEQIASEITLMETTKPYFEFVAIYAACGIPEVTLMGTTEDWQKVYENAMRLRSYDLDWWIDELKPILAQFINASKGKTDIKFWRNMFKWHTQEEYGAPNIIDGWIVKFFPYDKYDKRFNLKTLTLDSNLPNEMSKADVRFTEIYENGSMAETMIELHGGFIGLEQNPVNYALTPKIGWMVKKKIDEEAVNLINLKREIHEEGRVVLNVKEIPVVLNKVDTLPVLALRFVDEVHFPDWMEQKCIRRLLISGKITPEERDKLLRWYPSTALIVNGIGYEWEEGVLNVRADANNGSIIDGIDGIDSIGTLHIDNEEMKGFYYTGKILDFSISNNVTKRINKIILSAEPSRKCKKNLKRQFPNTEIKWEHDSDYYED